jgi:excisionase family DNA binding protein
MKHLRKFLKEQFDYVAILDRQCDPDQTINVEVAEIVEEARRRCCEFGFSEIGDVEIVLSPRSALPTLGKLLSWAREQKSKNDWLSPPQVAKMLGVKGDTVRHWIHSGQLPAVNVAKKEGGRPQFAVTPAGLDIFATRRSTRPPVKQKRARPKSPGKVYV